jgi:hypothetical protein
MENISERVKYPVVFFLELHNNFSEYAESARFIDSIQKGENFELIENILLPKFSKLNKDNFNEKTNIQDIYSRILEKKIIKYDSDSKTINKIITQNEKIIYIFEINIDPERENDITYLHYYFLIRQLLKIYNSSNEIFLILKTNSGKFENPLKFKISHFLSLELRKDRNCAFYMENDKAIHFPYTYQKGNSTESTVINVKQLRGFFPLLEINRKSFELLAKPVGELIKEIFSDESSNTLPYTEGNLLFVTRDESFDLPLLLYNNTLALLNSGYMKRRMKSEDFSSEFFRIVKDLPLLTLMIFVVSSREKEEKSYPAFKNDEEIVRDGVIDSETKMGIYEATNYAEGILQLLENIVEHSQNSEGYFSFRIHHVRMSNHEDKNIFSNPYLQKEYKEYFENISQKRIFQEENSELGFLEIFVSDALLVPKEIPGPINLENRNQKSPVTDVFINNIKTRINSNEKYLEDYQPNLQETQLYEFFGEGLHLKDYEADSHNIINHYGLKRFSNSVSAAYGYFSAISTYKSKGVTRDTFYSIPFDLINNKNMADYPTIPGTFYQILLPLNVNEKYQLNFTGMETNIKNGTWKENFDTYIYDTWKRIDIGLCHDSKTKKDKIEENSKRIKNAIIGNYKEEFEKKDKFFVISLAENIMSGNPLSAEIISKAIIQALSDIDVKEIHETITLVLGDCPNYFIPEFIHYMMIAYDRFNDNVRSIMENRQIYCYGVNSFDDFLIRGKNLQEMLYHMKTRCALRGTFPSFLFLLNFILSKYVISEISSTWTETEDEIPFDLILKRNGVTLFEERAKNVLLNPISGKQMGSKIYDTHVFIGSKIHLHNFFDAETIFQSDYFTTRFAALLAKDIYNKILVDKEKNSCSYKLLGYGNYSELVVNKTFNFLERLANNRKEYNLSTPLIIDQDDSEEEFKRKLQFQEQQNDKYIFVVPINSTLTTHNKLYFWSIESFQKPKEKAFANYALVVVRDKADSDELSDLEKTFWWEIKNGEIHTRLSLLPIRYYLEISGGWEDPLKCPLCYPHYNFSNEYPLIETNVTSVIPMLQLEKTHNSFSPNVFTASNSPSTKKAQKVKELSEVAIYKHIFRADNHYLFYFSPDQLISKNRDDIKTWLKSFSPDWQNLKIFTYNFLVTPLNESNTDFVEMINETLFHNSAQILRFEINREYRSNFITKYSYITNLYENLYKMNLIWPQQTKIQFFFIDDGIITGRTIERAKSLITSLFPAQTPLDKKSAIDISVFEGIFVLINRLSEGSIRNYVDVQKYYSYANFPVSSIRNNSQFCYLCKLSDTRKKLAESSSTNELQGILEDSSKSIVPVQSSELGLNYSNKLSSQRVIYAAKISELIDELSVKKSHLTKDNIIRFINDEITNLSDNTNGQVDSCVIEVIEAILELLTKPYFVYRYTTRYAVLQVLSEFAYLFMEEITNEFHLTTIAKWNSINKRKNNRTRAEYILMKKVVDFIKQSDENKAIFFNLLLDEFSDLGSARIIRRDFIEFACRCEKLSWFREGQKNRTTSFLKYLEAVTKTLKMFRDESKSTWLEYLLTNGNEFQKNEDKDNNQFLDMIWYSKLGECLYLENTKTIQSALENLAKETRSAQTVTKPSEYYLDNFRKILEFNNVLYQNDKHEWKYNTLRINKTSDFSGIAEKSIQLDLSFQPENSEQNETESSFGDMARRIHYENIIEEMIQLEKYLQNAISKPEEDSSIFKDHFDTICEKINTIALGTYTEFILVPSAINSSPSNLLVFARKLNKFGFKVEHFPNNESDFQDSLFCEDTYSLQIDRLIIKLADYQKSQSFFIVIHYSRDNIFYNTTMRKIAFSLRNVLFFRGQIKKLIDNHLNGNSLQSWAFDSQRKLLLENIKISKHTDNTEDLYLAVNNLFSKDSPNEKNYSGMMQATILHLLADINISSLYHDTIVKPDCTHHDVNANVFRWDINQTITSVFSKELIGSLALLIDSSERRIEWNIPEISKISSYYISSPPEGYLLLISLIENAIKFSPAGGLIGVDILPFDSQSDVRDMFYFCIKNELCNDSFTDENDLAAFKEQLSDCIRYPNELRWSGINSIDNKYKIGGVSLYAANCYCRKILRKLGGLSTADIQSEPVIKCIFPGSPNDLTFQIRVPIIYLER